MRASVRFAQQRSEVIEDLNNNVMPGNKARAENLFHPRISKVIEELKGEIKTIERKVGKNKAWKQRIIAFPDGSTARMPTLEDLRDPNAAFVHPKQRKIEKEIIEFQQTQEIADLMAVVTK